MRRHVVLTLALWAVVYVAALLSASALALVGHAQLIRCLGQAWWWIAPASLAALVTGSGAVAVRAILSRIQRRRSTARRRAFEPLIEAASGATRVTDLAQLSRLIVHLVNRSLGLTQTALFVGDSHHDCFRLVAARYPRLLPERLMVSEAEPVVELVKAWRTALLAPSLRSGKASTLPFAAAAVQARAWMAGFEFDALVPAYLNQRLVGLLALGHRRDGSRFTPQELELLRGLGSQVALGIENAKLFEELQANQASLLDTDKLANLGRLAAGLAHDINNPLTVISGEAQLHLERHKGHDQALDRLLNSIIEECQRAANMGRQVLRFAKASVSQLGPVNVGEIVEESLALAGYHVRMEQVDRSISIAAALPRVWGNRSQLEGVVLKLIFTVCRAIDSGGGTLEIQAAAEDEEVEVRICQGEGIQAAGTPTRLLPMTALHETETAPVNGAGNSDHGVGFFVSQRIVQAHRGSLSIDYTADGRVCFVLRVPSLCESTPSAGYQSDASGHLLSEHG